MDTALMLTSTAFANGGVIPEEYTCDGKRELSPPLAISGAPEGTKSFVLIMDDPDIPEVFKESHGIDSFDHWTLYNIPASTTEIPENSTVGTSGLNGAGKEGYIGPCPPPQYEPREHRYIFKLYALRDTVHFEAPPTKQNVLDALAPLLLAETELIGRYSRK
ncbi:MAG TPA: YbhB/YbcL family Raf kinase inhibitor-like protein [Candidatus Paceibacterota bacterium]|nr:YbhB/YbcL family Raf kinase inhibitor-like protein [Candidatus Paceibacterota bacterium]